MIYFRKTPIVFIFIVWVSCLFSLEFYDPIAVYLTWKKNPESTMSIQWISNKAEVENTIYYAELTDSEDQSNPHFFKQIGSYKVMPQGHPYLIHTAELESLKPDTPYLFKISENGALFKFKTMPKSLTSIRFVEGGDIYHDTIDIVATTNCQAAKLNPMFALLGGDLAYAADSSEGIFPEDAFRWINWLTLWKKTMVTTEGFLIPIVPVIGNHETSGGYGKTATAAPFFYSLFPMPGSQGYNVLDFGDYMSLILLDSGHTNPIEGKQADWLHSTLQARQNVPYKFAVYHVPAYPSIRSFFAERSALIRKSWVPSFDQFSLRVAFEHHDHAYKRTHPLKKGMIHEKGVVYLGDGAWGVAGPRRARRHRAYLAKRISTTHFILVTLNEEGVKYQGINTVGDTIDQYFQKK